MSQSIFLAPVVWTLVGVGGTVATKLIIKGLSNLTNGNGKKASCENKLDTLLASHSRNDDAIDDIKETKASNNRMETSINKMSDSSIKNTVILNDIKGILIESNRVSVATNQTLKENQRLLKEIRRNGD